MRDLKGKKKAISEVDSLAPFFQLDCHAALSLQEQIRIRLVEGIHAGTFVRIK